MVNGTYPPTGTGTSLEKALFEIIGQESVENGIHGRVGVAQATRQQKRRHEQLGMTRITS